MIQRIREIPGGRLIAIAVAAAVAMVLILALLTNIFERQQEGRSAYQRVMAFDDTVGDPAVWGANFPRQYESYLRTVDQSRTRYGGSEAVPRTPDDADPRSIVSQSKLEEDPRLKAMWAGYAFAIDFREERGHAFMLSDQRETDRVKKKQQPGACLNCHASTYLAYRTLGDGDPHKGFAVMNAMPYEAATAKVEHAVACIDCHNPKDMSLRVSRPAFEKGIAAYKATLGHKNYDVNEDASRQEMRSYVCAQCHVEYYFDGKDTKTLTFPWSKGIKVEEIYSVYQQKQFRDWTHKTTGAAALKAQHPEFEMWSQGIHARSGVACADCHMPYVREGATKFSSHHVQSPLLTVEQSCGTCHAVSPEEMKARVENIQEKTFVLRGLALDALVEFISDLERAQKTKPNAPEIKRALEFQRQAQFYIDYVEAENSMGFHAPQEATRILGTAIDLIRQGQRALYRK
ncbi:MAG: ammonia-forming cytochrome c nitrite reductase subunit c552 [bacterium]|nr:ammonia-forming cytochrome c nitrite reductase subunit c552 [bacterium]